MKRAVFFITCNGKMFKGLKLNQEFVKSNLLLVETPFSNGSANKQLSLFDDYQKALRGDL